MIKNQFLSPHFTLQEFTESATAKKHGIDNTPSGMAVQNLKRLCLIIRQTHRKRDAYHLVLAGTPHPGEDLIAVYLTHLRALDHVDLFHVLLLQELVKTFGQLSFKENVLVPFIICAEILAFFKILQ